MRQGLARGDRFLLALNFCFSLSLTWLPKIQLSHDNVSTGNGLVSGLIAVLFCALFNLGWAFHKELFFESETYYLLNFFAAFQFLMT